MHDLTFDPVDHQAACSRRNSLWLDINDSDGLGSKNGASWRRASLVSTTTTTTTTTRRGRSPPSSPSRPRKRISVKDVDFYPTTSSSLLNNDGQQHLQLNDHHLSLPSFNTTPQTSSQVQANNCPPNLSFETFLTMKPEERAKYHSTLSSLAESMKRTEHSRQQVILQRSLLTPDQHDALEDARARQLQAIQTEALIPVQSAPHASLEECPTRSGILDAFFAGSRGTLTNGLEQSRRQLRSYMGQVQKQTL